MDTFIESHIVPEWDEIEEAREKTEDFLNKNGFNPEIIDAVTMVTGELIENAIKYGTYDTTNPELTYSVEVGDTAIIVEVKNPISAEFDTNLEKLASLNPVLGSDWITAGISSPVTDGASAVVLMSETKMKELNFTPLARIVANAVVGSDPALMLTGPIDVTPKVLAKAGMKINDIDIFEVNEAFAPIPLAWVKAMKAPITRLNVNGGAMALGHPVGNSGCRLTVTATHELQRREARYALITLCTGAAMAPATIIERA